MVKNLPPRTTTCSAFQKVDELSRQLLLHSYGITMSFLRTCFSWYYYSPDAGSPYMFYIYFSTYWRPNFDTLFAFYSRSLKELITRVYISLWCCCCLALSCALALNCFAFNFLTRPCSWPVQIVLFVSFFTP
jgi:hypothetical protein